MVASSARRRVRVVEAGLELPQQRRPALQAAQPSVDVGDRVALGVVEQAHHLRDQQRARPRLDGRHDGFPASAASRSISSTPTTPS